MSLAQLFRRGTTVQDAVNAVSNLFNNSVTGDLERASRAVINCVRHSKTFKGLLMCVDSITEPTTRELARGIVLGVARTIDPTVTDWNALRRNADTFIGKAAMAVLMNAFGYPQAPTPAPGASLPLTL